jgi:hypothetical protein
MLVGALVGAVTAAAAFALSNSSKRPQQVGPTASPRSADLLASVAVDQRRVLRAWSWQAHGLRCLAVKLVAVRASRTFAAGVRETSVCGTTFAPQDGKVVDASIVWAYESRGARYLTFLLAFTNPRARITKMQLLPVQAESTSAAAKSLAGRNGIFLLALPFSTRSGVISHDGRVVSYYRSGQEADEIRLGSLARVARTD